MKTTQEVIKVGDRIKVTDEITGRLTKEFDCSNQTILNALKFFNNSWLSREIRKRAIELMRDVAKQNERLVQIEKQTL